MQAATPSGVIGPKALAAQPLAAARAFWRELGSALRQTARDLDRAEAARGGFRASAAQSD
jgi:hypothetical protein